MPVYLINQKSSQVEKIRKALESERFQHFIVTLIVINSVTIGLETSPAVMAKAGTWLLLIDDIILGVFAAELLLKLVVYNRRFSHDAWNIFDLSIVILALIPSAGPLAVLRTLRILRTLRLLKNVPKLRLIIEALLKSIPSIGWIGVLVMVIFYIFAVIGTSLYGQQFPQYFGDLGVAMFTLFQIMTLESWASGIARPVMSEIPNSWIFFIPFILLATYTTLNIFIAIVVNTINELNHEEEVQEEKRIKDFVHDENVELQQTLHQLRKQLERIEKKMQNANAPDLLP